MADDPVAVSRLGKGDSREAQNARAVKWLLAQPGGTVVVVTPRRVVNSAGLKRLIAQPHVQHHVWRGHHGGQRQDVLARSFSLFCRFPQSWSARGCWIRSASTWCAVRGPSRENARGRRPPYFAARHMDGGEGGQS